MDQTCHDQVRQLFLAGVQLRASDRQAFIDESCGEDDRLRQELLSLFEADSDASEVLDKTAGELSEALLSAGPDEREMGPYRLLEVIGEGGMGTVFLAERTDLENKVALKILRNAWLSPAHRRRFADEQRTLAQLDHHAIARLYDAGTMKDGTPWIAMEYVNGCSLSEYCTNLALAECLGLFARVCEAVQYAHTRLIVHRDLKPANILVSRAGEVKLLDFGIAKSIADARPFAEQTRTILRLVTPAYASPEQLRGEAVDVRSDVYSLGVILYELLTARLPRDTSEGATADADSASGAAVPSPASSVSPKTHACRGLGRGTWADLDALCAKALSPTIARRYATVDALHGDVERFLRGAPLEARPDTITYRAGKFVRRNRTSFAVSLVGAVVLAAVGVSYTVRITTARNEAVIEATRAKRVQKLMLSLLTGNQASTGAGREMRVVDLLDRGAREAARLGGDVEVQSTMLSTIGSLYQKLGDFDRAEELLGTALEQRRRVHGEPSLEVSETLGALARVHLDREDFDAAEKTAGAAVRMLRAMEDTEPATVATAVELLANIALERGDYRGALEHLVQAEQLALTAPRSDEALVTIIRSRAIGEYYLAQLDEAEADLKRATELTIRLRGPDHPNVADDLLTLGEIDREREDFAAADGHYRRARDILEAWYGAESYVTARAMAKIGRNLGSMGRPAEARTVLKAAIEVHKRTLGPQSTAVATGINDLAVIEGLLGNQAEVWRLSREAVRIYESVHGSDHYYVGVAKANLASVLYEDGQLDEAERLLRETLVIYAKTLPPEAQAVGIARLKLGRVLLLQQRCADAEVETLIGYRSLGASLPPGSGWLQTARGDLVKIYRCTDRGGQEAKYLAEHTKWKVASEG
ncbi:MAG: serine/threonine-protein kinase [Nannocystaceae bacterium]